MFGKFYIDTNTNLTLREIYKSKGYDFKKQVITIVCEGEARIPFPVRYLDVPYPQAFAEIAAIVKKQNLFIKDEPNGKIAKNFVHHFESFPPQIAAKLEEKWGLQTQAQSTLIKQSASPTKLLVLDVEGTLITEYDYFNELPDGRFPAVIAPDIKGHLENLQKAGFIT